MPLPYRHPCSSPYPPSPLPQAMSDKEFGDACKFMAFQNT